MDSAFRDVTGSGASRTIADHGLEWLTRLRHGLLSFLLLSASIAFGQSPAGLPQLFSYQFGDAATDLQMGVRVNVNTEVLTHSVPGDAAEFRTTGGSSYIFVTDSVTTSKTGNSHWVAHLQGSGTENRAILSYGNGIAFGHISTPDGSFRLDTEGGQIRLLDLKASTRQPQIFDEPLIPPSVPKRTILGQTATPPMAQAGPVSGLTVIDLLVLYTNGLADRLGMDAMSTRIENLVALTNQAYIDSQVNIQLRLVYSTRVNYSDHVTHVNALNDLTNGVAPFDGVAHLRDAYGADLVALLNQLDSSADPGMCGVAWTLGSGGTVMQPSFAFSVISVGDDIARTNLYCSAYGLAHETGHSLGNAHDRAHAAGAPGAFPYSYGHGSSGKFGTIMSYINPIVGRFSNPAIVCDSANDPCGIPENDPNGANNALSINNTAATVAAFRASTGLDTTPDNFSFTTLSGVNGGDALQSEVIVVSGLSMAVPISISGGQYSIDGAAFTSASGTVSNGQTVQVSLSAANAPYATSAAMLTIGTQSRAFRVVTGPPSSSATPAVAAGAQHSMALRTDGSVWSWGDNTYGQLGDGTLSTHSTPTQLVGFSSVTAIAAGNFHSLALKSDGSVWGWGASLYGQLGSTGGASNQLPIQVSGLSNITRIAAADWDSLAIDTNGAIWYWGNNTFTPFKVSGISNVIAATPGYIHRLALVSDGSLRAWGDNSKGQLGTGNTQSSAAPVPVTGADGTGRLGNVTAISAGEYHNLVLRSDGTVWAWGDNSFGQLGDGSTTQRNAPVAVTGVGGSGQLNNVVAIFAGQRHSLAVKSDGSVVAWGLNIAGQLGDGSAQNRLTPVPLSLTSISAVGAFLNHSLALGRDGTVWAWGYNGQGQLGDASTTLRTTPIAAGAADWSIGGADMEPGTLSLGSGSGLAGSTVSSSAITVSAIDRATPISILGGQYSIDGAAFTAGIGSITAGQNVTVRVTAAVGVGSMTTARLTIGGALGTFTVTTIGQLGQVIVFGTAPNLVDNGVGTLSATGGASGNPIVFSSTTPAICTVSGDTVTGVNAGTCVVAANQAGNANYAAAPQVTQSFLVAKGTQTIIFGSAPTLIVGGAATVSATGGASGNPVIFNSTTPAICTLAGSTVSGLAVGVCTITANQAGNANFPAALQVTQSIQVGRGTQVISFGGVPTLVAGGMAAVSASGGATGNPVIFSSTTPGICTVAGSTVSGWAVGNCAIAANQAGNANYEAAPPTTQIITVGQGTQVISFGAAPSLVVGGSVTLSASGGASGNPVVFSSTTSAVCAVDGDNVAALSAGACVITANQAGNASYTSAGQVTQTISVGGASVNLLKSWNLLGNGMSQPLSVVGAFGDRTLVTTVWKWDVATLGWQFYSPAMDAATLQAYASSKGYTVLGSINPGDGFWVNAVQAFTVAMPAGTTISATAFQTGQIHALKPSWNLVGIGNALSPSAFNAALSLQTPAVGVVPINLTTLWAWDSSLLQWYFYSPTLEDQGGTALTDYITAKGYLDFTAHNKVLGLGLGFWVNKPQ